MAVGTGCVQEAAWADPRFDHKEALLLSAIQPTGELGPALTRLVAALESVNLDGLQSGDRDLVEQALLAARAALDRATSGDEPFPQED